MIVKGRFWRSLNGQPMSIRMPIIKRLFAESGNLCAFPRCDSPLIHLPGGSVVGQICHIKAESPEGPRYDSSQSDDERNGYENLILLCSAHHKVIDDDEVAYTVSRLTSMKAEHRDRRLASPEAEEPVLASLVINANVVGGSVISTHNQIGGQVAHLIQNIGTLQRHLTAASAATLRDLLRRHTFKPIRIVAVNGDGEAFQLAVAIRGAFHDAGWELPDVATRMYHVPPEWLADPYENRTQGLVFEVDRNSDDNFTREVLDWLSNAGLRPRGIKCMAPSHEGYHLIVGHNQPI